MSYVLDALRRAEADRHRGQVPDLHASAHIAAASVRPMADPGHRPGLARGMWALAVALLAMLALLATLAMLAMLAPGALVSQGAWWGVDRGPAASTGASAAPLTPTSPGAAEPTHQTPPPSAAPIPPPVALPEPTTARRARGDAASARSSDPASAPAQNPPILSPRPPMSFGGALDSPDPRARMLIINGQVWREGDTPVPGWLLERIGLHRARFQVQGRAVELDYASAAGANR